MRFYDFEYDGLSLSSMGFIICDFGSNGMQTLSNGSKITFNTVSFMNGSKHMMTSSQYDDCLETTFQICKNPCLHHDLKISLEELRGLMNWLNRRSFCKFKLVKDSCSDLYFEASFNISRIEINGEVYGLELEMKTNRPFALREPLTLTIHNTTKNGTASVFSISDEEGGIYPRMEITIKEDGDLSITNSLDEKIMFIANCVVGEVITLDYPMIESSLSSHKILDDFNWNFFRISNTFQNNQNDLTISIPCIIKLTYSPVVKVGI